LYAVVALTSNVIGTWFVSPETTTVVLVAPTSSLRKWPFSVQVTSYPVIALPPSLAGGDQLRVAFPSPGVAVRSVGARKRRLRTFSELPVGQEAEPDTQHPNIFAYANAVRGWPIAARLVQGGSAHVHGDEAPREARESSACNSVRNEGQQ
jgi:hypothetical protein